MGRGISKGGATEQVVKLLASNLDALLEAASKADEE